MTVYWNRKIYDKDWKKKVYIIRTVTFYCRFHFIYLYRLNSTVWWQTAHRRETINYWSKVQRHLMMMIVIIITHEVPAAHSLDEFKIKLDQIFFLLLFLYSYTVPFIQCTFNVYINFFFLNIFIQVSLKVIYRDS